MFFDSYFHNMSSASGGFAPRPHRGSAPGPRWGTSVPQTPWFPYPYFIFKPATVHRTVAYDELIAHLICSGADEFDAHVTNHVDVLFISAQARLNCLSADTIKGLASTLLYTARPIAGTGARQL